MARVKPKTEKQKAAALAKLRALFPDVAIPDTFAPPETVYDNPNTTAQTSVLSMYMSLQPRHRELLTRKCARSDCQKVFRTDYLYDTFCSYTCLAHSLKEETGIEYDPTRNRWAQWHPPMKTDPVALLAMERFCQQFLEELNRVRQEPAPKTPQESVAQIQQAQIQQAQTSEQTPVEAVEEHPPVLDDVVPTGLSLMLPELDLSMLDF